VGVIAWRLGYACLLGLYSWSAISGAIFLVDHRQELNDRQYINRLLRYGAEIRRTNCDRNGLEMLEYPYNPMVYFVNKIPPASKYTFMHPWVAQIALPELISELRVHPSAVVVIKTTKQVWEVYPANVYLAPLIEFLNQNYQTMGRTLWKSREISGSCDASPPQLPDEGILP
jgi:hypothetical protein